MAEKHGVFIYAEDCDDFSTTGLVGDLKPLMGTFTEEKNGTSEIKIRIPYDKLERWKAAKVGRIIRCEVPVRIPPVIENDEYANTTEAIQPV